jgi:hypothetical protein
MGQRTSPRAIEDANDLSQLATIVQDKRNGKRSGAKQGRRNRHYENQLIRNALSAGMLNSISEIEQIEPTDDLS